ncbi:hypothetical protein L7F22_006826 [Adiantum nelumboides]|nr:hypothetical protein [Adiantum nelumboides]
MAPKRVRFGGANDHEAETSNSKGKGKTLLIEEPEKIPVVDQILGDSRSNEEEILESDIDHCLYTKRAEIGSLLIMILYVDIMVLARTNVIELEALQSKLNDNFDMKDLGDTNHILCMRIVRDRDKQLLYLSQT